VIVIVGAGYAGAATAAALGRRGLGSRVTLIEAETTPGRYASGLNAGLVSPLFEKDEAMAAFAASSIARLKAAGLVRACGSIRLADDAAAAEFLARAERHNLPVQEIGRAEAAAGHPFLKGARAPRALFSPDEGTLNPRELLAWHLEQATMYGARLMAGVRTERLEIRSGHVTGLQTSAGLLPATVVVNAAGAWASPVAEELGGVRAGGPLTGLGLVSYRRHIYVAPAGAGIAASLPWVWDLDGNIYVRMDGDTMLLCWCDETVHPPGEPDADPDAAIEMRRRFAAALPAVASAIVDGVRVCLRTFAPDRRYVIGSDPRLPGFFWIAGLGGTGATASAAVGELAAELLSGEAPGPRSMSATLFDPARLIPDNGGNGVGS